MSVSPKSNWESYSYQTDNGPVVVSFHTDSDKIDRGQFPLCARVQISIKAPNHNGGPHQSEAETLWAMEDRLVEALDARQVSCHMLGRLTYNGMRELVFQVADYEPFRPPVGRWMQEHSTCETDVSEHDGWDFFFESVWPSEISWQIIMDRRVVDNLVCSGSDPAKPHSLEFVFRGAAAALEELQRSLASRGYTLIENSPEESRLVMALSMPLQPSAISNESISHHTECAKLGLEYDGWGAMTVA
ncbi:hypothetical protein BH09VER1_BH09VER1_03130 [soil metagenome]